MGNVTRSSAKRNFSNERTTGNDNKMALRVLKCRFLAYKFSNCAEKGKRLELCKKHVGTYTISVLK